MTDEMRVDGGADENTRAGVQGGPAWLPGVDHGVSHAMPREVYILYKNWRGDVGWRRVMPHEILFGSTPWHREAQWLLRATDLEKGAERHFALSDVQAWGRPTRLAGAPGPQAGAAPSPGGQYPVDQVGDHAGTQPPG